MKKPITKRSVALKMQLFFAALIAISTSAMSQNMPEVTANGKSVSSWFSNNWLWITIFIIVLIAVILMMSGGNRRQSTTTTIVKDDNGNVQRRSTTTTEIDE